MIECVLLSGLYVRPYEKPLAGMVIFHIHIFSTFPLAVPLEWNVFMIFGLFFLFGHYADVPWSTLDDPLLVAILALTCLRGAGLEAGQRILIYGASGAIGTAAVQLAKHFGAGVTAVCNTKNVDTVAELGADEVVDYTSQDVVRTLLASRTEGRKFDLYIDCVGGTEVFEHWGELLHKNGAYVTIVGDKTSRTAMGGPLTYFTYPKQVWRYLRGWAVGPRYANVLLYQRSELLEQVARLALSVLALGLAERMLVDVVDGRERAGSEVEFEMRYRLAER